MNQTKFIFFDCMETIVDLNELPLQNDYALWTFTNSGVEHYWSGFEEFLDQYNLAKKELRGSLAENQEYEIIERLEHLVESTGSISSNLRQHVTKRLYDTYWESYKSKCYVKEEIKSVLIELAQQYKLAVVSNFKIKARIEELLEINGLINLFEFVHTSINIGWCKPDPRIYEASIQFAGCNPEQIIFVGDDYENDYLAPRRLGMKSIFLDKAANKSSGIDKVLDFDKLKHRLLG